MMDKHQEAFKEEAYELLAELETSLLELEGAPDDMELIGRVFRAMHTIKGSGAMFGFDDIAAFTHEVETVLDLVRNSKIRVTKELVDLALSARDQIRAMLDAADGGEPADEVKAREITESLRKFLSSAGEKESTPTPAENSADEENLSSESEKEEQATYRIRFRPARDIFSNGTNPLFLIDELRELGACKVVAQTEAIPLLEEIDPELCYTSWDIILTTSQGIDAIKDVFIFVEEDCELKIDAIDCDSQLDEEAGYKKVGDILMERGDLTPEGLKRAIQLQEGVGSQKRLGAILQDNEGVSRDQIDSALAEQQHIREIREKRQNGETTSSIRVPSERLDQLVDLVGELVTIQARLSQTVNSLGNAELLSIAEEVERLTEELRDNTMSIRMLPIGTTFSKFKRLVRDLSNELGREVEMTTDGAETELDKTVIDRLNEPLVHLIRNSIDHGIEPPEVREALGKPRKGNVHLSAEHSGANVLIQIRDDGAGLDQEAIRAKAVSRGLILPDAELSEKEIFALILAPGFSTAKEVTSVSGRGVGMDVVQRAIEALRGLIEIDSRKGIGTTIILKLPLTLAIIEGLLVGIGKEYFVLPLSAVEECVELSREDVEKAHDRHLTNVRGEIVPYIRLRERFRVNGGTPEIEQIVITRINDSRIGFVVDHVVGEHQTVIKSLGKTFKGVDEVSGATILGDGTVALILDVSKMVRDAEMEEEQALRS